MKSKLLVLLGLMIYTLSVQAQDTIPQKQESEISISQDDFPQNAITLLQHVSEVDKIKFFQRQPSDGEEVYEAKLKLKGHEYNASFDSVGTLRTVEVQIDYKEISPDSTAAAVKQYFEDNFQKMRVLSTTKKFFPAGPGLEIDTVIESIQKGEVNTFLIVKYQVQVSGQRKSAPATIYDVTFDHLGVFEKMQQVELHNMENIIF